MNRTPTSLSIEGVGHFLRASEVEQDYEHGSCSCCPNGDHIYSRMVNLDPAHSSVFDRPIYSLVDLEVEFLHMVNADGKRVRITFEVIEPDEQADLSTYLSFPVGGKKR